MENTDQFLATIVEAAVAVVAIVGGLLVSRIVSLSTDRSGLTQRRDDLRVLIEKAKGRYGELEDRLLQLDAGEILEPHYQRLAHLPEEVHLAGMIVEAESTRTVEEIQPFLDDLLRRFREARVVLEPLFENEYPDVTLEELDKFGRLPIDLRGDWAIYDAALDALYEENKPLPASDRFGLFPNVGALPGLGLDSGWSTVSAIRNQAEQAEHAQVRRDRDDARHLVDSLEAQVVQTDQALAAVSRPTGVTPAVLVLGYFTTVAATGLLLMVGSDRLEPWAAWIIAAAFVVGLVALLVYLQVIVRRVPS